MSDLKCDRVSAFRIEGKFLGFVVDGDGTPKYLQLEVETGELRIKLAKQSRFTLGATLQPNDWIEIQGEKKFKYKTGELKLKADRVNQLTAKSDSHHPGSRAENGKVKIVVCYKSGCLKKGGSKLLSDLEKVLHDRGLGDRVVIQTTGCLKRCSQAPNLILKPGNIRLNNMTSEATIAALLDSVLAK
jgi:NADH:ubiquinone oxidoreductase subunit E